MKKTLLIPLLVGVQAVLAASANEIQKPNPATALLNDALIPLYQDVVGGKPATDFIGRSLDLSLSLRFCSEKHLLFDDTKIIVDEETKYYFVKWVFEPTVVKPVIGKKNVQCRIKGKITEVRRGETTPGMPHLIVKLETIVLQQFHAR